MKFTPIGRILSPYVEDAPFRPDAGADGEFIIEIFEPYVSSLEKLETFSHLILLYHFHKGETTHLKAHPPGSGQEVGTLASRSPNRVNKVGMNVAGILRIEKNRIYTTPLDALNHSPVIDIKPYIKDLDCRPEANNGWLDQR